MIYCHMTLDSGGNRHYFMTFDMYSRWCLGRTYMWEGKMYHSGLEMSTPWSRKKGEE